jgi:hypothetical protein
MSWTVTSDNITFKGHPLKIDSPTGIVTTDDFVLSSIVNAIFDVPIQVDDGAELSLRQVMYLILKMLPTLKPSPPCKPCRQRLPLHNIY